MGSGERIREGLDGMVLYYKQSPGESPDVKLSQSYLLRVTRASEWMGARMDETRQWACLCPVVLRASLCGTPAIEDLPLRTGPRPIALEKSGEVDCHLSTPLAHFPGLLLLRDFPAALP